MPYFVKTTLATAILCLLIPAPVPAAGSTNEMSDRHFRLNDLFHLETASDPQISPDGRQVVFVRTSSDIMKDKNQARLWIIASDGTDLRPLTTGDGDEFSPRWSPDGKRLLYAARSGGPVQVYVRWMDSGQTAKVTSVQKAPGNMAWSPDGKWIAFTMLVLEESKPFAEMPAKPEGAEWGKPPKVVRKLIYRADGAGYLEDGYDQVFVVPAESGTPRQLTRGAFNHEGPLSWTPDGQAILFASNRRENWEYDPLNSEIYDVFVRDGKVNALTDRKGPDRNARISPDGKSIAYLGFDDREQGYQVTRLYVMNRDGSASRMLSRGLDRDIDEPQWSEDGQTIYFQYDDQGNTRIAAIPAQGGDVRTLARDLGGVSHGRPYASGSFSVAKDGRFAYTQSRPDYPADIAVGGRGGDSVQRVTRLNEDLFAFKQLGTVEELWFESSFDKRKIQSWIVRPPEFVANRKYPLILEIHGGPFANYGDRFTSEIQLFAAAGYVVLYVNPRGSTSYGEEFGNLIHHHYPGEDYDDLMSGVRAAIDRGYVDPENLFVTGGSGGGVLTAWIVGKTNQFRAAVVTKPVINWYSFVLTSDANNFFYRYWFPGFPWDHAEHYLKRSPLSLVGNVTTPTMLLTGEMDYRTPIAESEQYYQALKLRKVDTALVRLPEASHGMAGRPTQLIAKVAHILKWFEQYRTDKKKG